MNAPLPPREGGLDAPTRHPIDWKNPSFWDPDALAKELERVFDICHGCRRCVSLCQAFPTLFDLVDAAGDAEVSGLTRADHAKVVEQCYLCDLCYQTKCPYVPPHAWNLDFPHLMLRAKAIRHRAGGTSWQSRVLASTTTVGRAATLPGVAPVINAINRIPVTRKLVGGVLGIHPDAVLPRYNAETGSRRARRLEGGPEEARVAGPTRGRVALLATCYGDHHLPQVVEDLAAILRHNAIAVQVVAGAECCGMPRLELGDLDGVARLKDANLPRLAALVDAGFDLLAPIPSCVLMFRQEIPLLFPDDAQVASVRRAFFDPFEYLMHRHAAGLLRTDFPNALGRIAYHAPCHQRVQNIGPRTRDVLALIPGTEVELIERCSGHDGTYGVRQDTHARARRIARPVVDRIARSGAAWVSSDCPMAGAHLAAGLAQPTTPRHPLSLLRQAYGI